ncbi:hypothetical protein ACYSNW_14045 [Enterococcus sp. LJL99]
MVETVTEFIERMCNPLGSKTKETLLNGFQYKIKRKRFWYMQEAHRKSRKES